MSPQGLSTAVLNESVTIDDLHIALVGALTASSDLILRIRARDRLQQSDYTDPGAYLDARRHYVQQCIQAERELEQAQKRLLSALFLVLPADTDLPRGFRVELLSNGKRILVCQNVVFADFDPWMAYARKGLYQATQGQWIALMSELGIILGTQE